SSRMIHAPVTFSLCTPGCLLPVRGVALDTLQMQVAHEDVGVFALLEQSLVILSALSEIVEEAVAHQEEGFGLVEHPRNRVKEVVDDPGCRVPTIRWPEKR